MHFLGRVLDENTMTYIYPDGSGGNLPEEMRQDVLDTLTLCGPDGFNYGSSIAALAVLWDWKKRLGLKA